MPLMNFASEKFSSPPPEGGRSTAKRSGGDELCERDRPTPPASHGVEDARERAGARGGNPPHKGEGKKARAAQIRSDRPRIRGVIRRALG